MNNIKFKVIIRTICNRKSVTSLLTTKSSSPSNILSAIQLYICYVNKAVVPVRLVHIDLYLDLVIIFMSKLNFLGNSPKVLKLFGIVSY